MAELKAPYCLQPVASVQNRIHDSVYEIPYSRLHIRESVFANPYSRIRIRESVYANTYKRIRIRESVLITYTVLYCLIQFVFP